MSTNDNQINLNFLRNWFNECNELENEDQEQIKELVENTINNDKLINLIYQLLEDKNYHDQYLEEICKHLFKLYLTKNDKIQLFVISFIPTLIAINLINSLDSKLKKLYNFIDVFLISIYNFSLINDDGTIKERSFRIPNLNKSSIYHFPEINNDLSEIAIRKLEKCYKENRILYVQDNVDQHYLNATNRMIVYCNLMQIYHDSISLLSKQSLSAFCRKWHSILNYNNNINDLKLVNIKYDLNTPIDYLDILNKSRPKLQLSSNFLLQLLNCFYFCVYNGVENQARECIIDIHKKAMSYLYTDVLLMTNAIINSLSISKQSLENECMGINIFKFTTNSEIKTNSGQTKSAITNASFKTQKLPEDIEIKLPINNNQDNLNTITEETTNDQEKSFSVNNQSMQQQQQTNQHNQSIKLATKENLNGFAIIKTVKDKDKKDKKKKRTKSSNLDDVNLQILNKNEHDTLNEEEKVPLI